MGLYFVVQWMREGNRSLGLGVAMKEDGKMRLVGA